MEKYQEKLSKETQAESVIHLPFASSEGFSAIAAFFFGTVNTLFSQLSQGSQQGSQQASQQASSHPHPHNQDCSSRAAAGRQQGCVG